MPTLRVRGLVQGVGFRPYVWRLATELGLNGWVRNDGAGVTIAASGAALDAFLARLPLEAPRLARIDAIETLDSPAVGAENLVGFSILESVPGAVATAIGPDAAVCTDCLHDIFDPANRRWRYVFTTCTHCGPRFTVSRSIPYDRTQTSLAPFALCPACEREYRNPADRRFHAETTCCPACGPQLQLLDSQGSVVNEGNEDSEDPITATLRLLQTGHIVAIKSLGGFHLACDARNADAVAQLRARKQREAKPLAVMALNAASLAEYALIGTQELQALQSPAAPIVLCRKTDVELPGIASDLAWLGVMLPSTPLQYLLWHEAAQRPAGTDWLDAPHPLLLVMSSANPHGEPLVIDNTEVLARLGGIADAYLLHNRAIVTRCDDSVRRSAGFIRRARGYTPLPMALAHSGPTVLALGAHLKNTVCVATGAQAYLSQHIGSLDNAASIGFLEETVTHLLAILDVRPKAIAHDLHPDYASTHLAMQLAAQWDVPAYAVAHHHAHIAAICAEHGLDANEPVLGLAMDGVGLGSDGGLWGGELLRVQGVHCDRIGHVQPLQLPGGERAAREPWRMAVSALHRAGQGARAAQWLAQRYPGTGYQAAPLLGMLERGFNAPFSSSLGRIFDAAAALLGLRAVAQYEGQAAMELESLAAQHGPVEPLAHGVRWQPGGPDFLPLLVHLCDCADAAYGAALFHATVAHGLMHWLISAAQQQGLTRIAIGGGCAMNGILMQALRSALLAANLTVLEARQAPPGDGGLALGQAWVASMLMKK